MITFLEALNLINQYVGWCLDNASGTSPDKLTVNTNPNCEVEADDNNNNRSRPPTAAVSAAGQTQSNTRGVLARSSNFLT